VEKGFELPLLGESRRLLIQKGLFRKTRDKRQTSILLLLCDVAFVTGSDNIFFVIFRFTHTRENVREDWAIDSRVISGG
jgi:hypothetical protein